MPTDSCDRCRDSISTALLRDIELRVDGDEVDEQTVCPDCFADWIAQYQERLAGDLPGAPDERSTVDESRTGSRTESVSTACNRSRSDNEIQEVGGLSEADDVDGDSAADVDDSEDDDGRPRLR